nr:replication initiator protein A [Frigidibacter mobilis]
MSLDILLKKSGSKSSEKEFRRSLRELAAGNHLPTIWCLSTARKTW